jgi:sodium transport system ATP-binding protein
MSEAEYLCDRIYLVHEGHIADHGKLSELLERSGCRNLTDAFFYHLQQAPVVPSPQT